MSERKLPRFLRRSLGGRGVTVDFLRGFGGRNRGLVTIFQHLEKWSDWGGSFGLEVSMFLH